MHKNILRLMICAMYRNASNKYFGFYHKLYDVLLYAKKICDKWLTEVYIVFCRCPPLTEFFATLRQHTRIQMMGCLPK